MRNAVAYPRNDFRWVSCICIIVYLRVSTLQHAVNDINACKLTTPCNDRRYVHERALAERHRAPFILPRKIMIHDLITGKLWLMSKNIKLCWNALRFTHRKNLRIISEGKRSMFKDRIAYAFKNLQVPQVWITSRDFLSVFQWRLSVKEINKRCPVNVTT
jgi:hypothetical protein